jgi:hypothetical protein
LIPYITAGVLPEKAKNRWRIPGKETEPLPGKDEFVIFLSFLDRGLAFLSSSFFRHFLAFYGIKISDLGPHSIQQIAFFVTLCEGYLGCPLYFPLWLSIFHGCMKRVSDQEGGQLIDCGRITFQVQGGEDFLNVGLLGKAVSSWRRQWFYMKEETPEGEPTIPAYPRRVDRASCSWVKRKH